MTNLGPPERVYVELDWYGGPIAGIANLDGRPHRFSSLFDKTEEEYSKTFVVWPIDERELALEIEQWRIFVDWNDKFESGEVDTESHPGGGGLNARWDEIDSLLKRNWSVVSASVQKVLATFEPIDREKRYTVDGPNYTVRWCIVPLTLPSPQGEGSKVARKPESSPWGEGRVMGEPPK